MAAWGAVGLLAVAALPACAMGPSEPAAAPTAISATPVSAHATELTGASGAHAWSFSDVAPAPPLPDANVAPARAAAMLLAYRDYLTTRDPDPALADRVFLRGTVAWRALRDELADLRARHLRASTPGAHYVVHSVRPAHAGDARVVVRDSARASVLVSADGSTSVVARTPKGRAAVVDLSAVGSHAQLAYLVPIEHLPGDAEFGAYTPPPPTRRAGTGTGTKTASPYVGSIHRGPHGGTLTVGLTVSMDGSRGVPADSPDAPSPYRVVSTPSRDATSPLAGLCNPGDGTTWGWTWRVQVIDTTTGAVVSDGPECVAFDPAIGPPGPGPVGTTPPTIGEIWKQAPIPLPPLDLSPPDTGVTGLATWMWSSSPATVAIDATLDGWTVVGVAHRESFLFDAGDGAGEVRTAGGGSLAAPAVRHVYETKGTYRVEVGTIWTATVAMTGPGLVAQPTSIGSAWLTESGDYPVVEVRSDLTQ